MGDQDVSAFVAVIHFSHPWRHKELKTTILRTICQDSTAYFLSVLSIQIFVTVAVSSGAAVSFNQLLEVLTLIRLAQYLRALFPVM